MPPSDDESTKIGIWDIFHIRPIALAQTPESLRAWATIIAAMALISLIICGLVGVALLGRLGMDAFQLPSPQYQEAARNFFLAFAGVFGAPFLIWRALVAHRQANAATEQARVAQENYVTGIFSKSVELLGLEREVRTTGSDGNLVSRSTPNTEARLGALYSLERLLDESEKDQRAILETLCAYVRGNSQLQIPSDEEEAKRFHRGELPPIPGRRIDVQAAITIIGRRSKRLLQRGKSEGWSLDFRNSNLAGYDFSKLNFDQSDFSDTFLNQAKLTGSSFIGSNFTRTNLSATTMERANFRSSNFVNSNLSKAAIDQTDFSFARIAGTDLREATVVSFNIHDADLEEAYSGFLEYAIEDARKNGPNGFNAQEIVKTYQLFQKASFNENTKVSQSVRDAILLMTTESELKSESTNGS